MIELTNSIRRQLGPNRFSLDCSLMPLQMREPGKDWENINPRLAPTAGGWVSEGTPYRVEIGNDGSRVVYPDRTDLSKYLRFPAIALFSGMTKTAQANGFTLSSPKVDLQFLLRNSRLGMLGTFKSAPAFDRITLDVESVGFDLAKLLSAKTGIGIPKPHLIDALGTERELAWSLKAGRIELGFDLTGLVFPVTLYNTTIDVQTGAGADDGYVKEPNIFNSNGNEAYVGNSNAVLNLWTRFNGISGLGGAMITASYLTRWVRPGAGNPSTLIYADDSAAPTAPTTYAEYAGKTPTTASVAWNGAGTNFTWENSASISTIIQELVDSYGALISVIQILQKDNGSGASNYQTTGTYEIAGNTYGMKLHIEYTSGTASGMEVQII